MKRTLLSIVAVAGFTAFSFGQIEISLVSNGPDVSGTQLEYTSPGTEVVVDLHVENLTGVSKNLTIERSRIDEKASWTDYVCWGHETDPFGGTCYPNYAANPWLTPTAVTIGNDEAGTLAIHINPLDPDTGCSIYRYRVMDGSVALDSIDIEVCKSGVSVDEIDPALSVTVAPNPANTFVKVKSNVESATIKVVDVLGNVVLREERVYGTTKTINTTSFRNGVYFVTVTADGEKPIIRKIIVRH